MTGRTWFKSRAWRLLSWAGLAAALPALWACNSRSLEAPILKPDKTNTITFQETVNRDIDILFLIDNSSSMSKSQTNLLANFPVFMDVLNTLPMGLPNVHIAVVSSDMGAGTGTGGCAGNGQAGIFQWGAPMTTCTPTTDGAKFLSNINGTANYTGDISTLFSCVAALGEGGCGFEQTLLSVTHALGADNFADGKPQPPQENQGFLREGAYLAIILITNEDDCSAPQGAASDLFPRAGDGSSLSAALGPPTGYRCNAFGHVCGTPQAAPPIMSPMGMNDPGDLTTVVPLQNCVSAEDSGRLIPVSAFAQVIKALKPDPANQILVAAISGLYPDNSRQAPYSVSWKKAPSGDPAGPWPEMVHSCVSMGDQSFADPGVRIGEWVKQFGRNGVLQSICDASFRPAMMRIADEIGRVLGPKCVIGVFNDKDPNAGGTQYDCVVTDHLLDPNTGNTTDSTVAACADNGGAHPCWHLDADNTCRIPPGAPANTQSLKLTTDRDGTAPSGLSTTISCALVAQQP